MTFQDVFINVLEAFIIAFVISQYFDKKNLKYRFLLFLILCAEINFSNIYNRFDIILPYIIIVTNIMITRIFSNMSIYEIISLCLLEDLTHSCNQILIIFILAPIRVNDFLISFVVQVTHFFISILLLTYIKKNIKGMENIYWKYIAIIIFSFSFSASIVIQLYFGMEASSIYYILILISVYITALGIYWIIFHINKINKERMEKEKIIHNLKLTKLNDAYIESINEQIHMIRHDLKHDYELIGYYLKNHQYSDIEKITQLRYQDIDSLTVIKCENKLIESIINSKMMTIHLMNKKLNCKINCYKDNCIKDYHLNEILCNLIDNMIEHSEGKNLDLTIQEDEIMLLIITKNLMKRNEEKTDNNEHGYGLKNINSIVEQYSGKVSIFVDKKSNTFECMVSVPKL